MTNELTNLLAQKITTLSNINQNNNAPPDIGYITNTRGHRRYADIKLSNNTQGTLTNILCWGIPEIGDTAIIIYLQGHYEQAIALCPRQQPATTEALEDYHTLYSLNYLHNGDTHNTDDPTLTGEYTIITTETATQTSTNSILLQRGQSITKTVDISECQSDNWKFQCYYRGTGTLGIHVEDTDTQKTIQTLPWSMRYNTTTWKTHGNRFAWVWNKETYPRKEQDGTTHKHIAITITNNTTDEDTDEFTQAVMLVDGLLVYDENNDKKYYYSKQDHLDGA